MKNRFRIVKESFYEFENISDEVINQLEFMV